MDPRFQELDWRKEEITQRGDRRTGKTKRKGDGREGRKDQDDGGHQPVVGGKGGANAGKV